MMQKHSFPTELFTGLILAGGQGSRMEGQDKGLVQLQGKPLVQYALDNLHPYANQILISANRNLHTYSQFGFPVIPDEPCGFTGPLTGLLQLLRQVKTPYAFCLPCDTPILPATLLSQLWQPLQAQSLTYSYVIAHDRPQPLIACMKTSVLDSLQDYLQSGQQRVFHWVNSLPSAPVPVAAESWELENINDPDRLKWLEAAIAKESR